MKNPNYKVKLSKLVASLGYDHKPPDLKQVSGQVSRTEGALQMLSVDTRQGCIQTKRLDACLGELFKQKGACLLSGF